MLDNSFSYCSNESCSKKDICLRYTKRENRHIGETYLLLTEKECEKNNCFIDKKEYYKKMILSVIDMIPNDDLDKKLLLENCHRLLPISEQYNLKDKLLEKIKSLEKN